MSRKHSPKARDLDFLYEIGALRNMPRAWIQSLGGKPASVLEHSLRVVFIALLLARREGRGNELKITKMALIHDLSEARTGDHNYNQSMYVDIDEMRASRDMLFATAFPDFLEILEEYKSRKSIESQIVKDADNLDIDLEMKEFEEQGHTLPRKWKAIRKLIRKEKFYTLAARRLWDEIQHSEPSSWHIADNKFLKVPGAGR